MANTNMTSPALQPDAEATVDAGAYSAYPFSACLEAAQVASILPGPYDFQAYRCRTWSAATLRRSPRSSGRYGALAQSCSSRSRTHTG